jgi:hypothetical protein
MTSTDRVVFEGPGGRFSAPWAKAWPPPELLYLVQSEDTITLVDPMKQSTAVIFRLITQHGALLYERKSASSVDAPAEQGEHWFRGALYQPKEAPRVEP